MSLLLTGALVATGVLLGRMLARIGAKKTPAQEPVLENDTSGEEQKAETPKPGKAEDAPRRIDLGPFPCKLGDVVLRAGGDEAWLAGALVFSEELPVAVLFVAPDAGGDRALWVRPSPSASMSWLSPLDKDALPITGEPPNVLEHDGARFERTRRLPLRVTRIGSGAPDVGDSAIVAEYTNGVGEVLLVVAASGSSRAWRGSTLEEGTYDVLPNGEGDAD